MPYKISIRSKQRGRFSYHGIFADIVAAATSAQSVVLPGERVTIKPIGKAS